ncbi:hypothetical protein SARC_06151 [Sphaeroforma arctica JP610]|uniref:Uncharacterized protein n=1 Tax=Sphaeroforma arctica JP610 TaxID=667725 RepID=A0A0L0FY11_9EUKA|nr:hypothetical protein SARC_06151 [Sphaeroforma arctica JP610]KNC81524.1 hypothetical protein SARC_06151 [Sphaeroforma arctica JP610]|eukprot:XP_014155426.1 hypothetical protein SARC_06151 [Sphaeroforma arctica JP610]
MLDKYNTIFVDEVDLSTCLPEVQTLRDRLGDGLRTETKSTGQNSPSSSNEDILDHCCASPMMSDVAPRIKTKRLNSMQCIESSSNKSDTAMEDTDTNLFSSQLSLGSGYRAIKAESLESLFIASLSAYDSAAVNAQRIKEGLPVEIDTTGWYAIAETITDDEQNDKATSATELNESTTVDVPQDRLPQADVAQHVVPAVGTMTCASPADIPETYFAAAPPRPTAGPPRPKTVPRKPPSTSIVVAQGSDTVDEISSSSDVISVWMGAEVDTGMGASDTRVPSATNTQQPGTEEQVDYHGTSSGDDLTVDAANENRQELHSARKDEGEVEICETTISAIDDRESPLETSDPANVENECTTTLPDMDSTTVAIEHKDENSIESETKSSANTTVSPTVAQPQAPPSAVTVADIGVSDAAPIAAPRPRTTSTHSLHSAHSIAASGAEGRSTTNTVEGPQAEPIDLMKALKQCGDDSSMSGSAVAEYMIQTMSKKSSECVCRDVNPQTEQQTRSACKTTEGSCVSSDCAVTPTVEEVADDVFHVIEQLSAFSPTLATAPSDA